eukprot:1184979-Rhodomonas_salina.2
MRRPLLLRCEEEGEHRMLGTGGSSARGRPASARRVRCCLLKAKRRSQPQCQTVRVLRNTCFLVRMRWRLRDSKSGLEHDEACFGNNDASKQTRTAYETEHTSEETCVGQRPTPRGRPVLRSRSFRTLRIAQSFSRRMIRDSSMEDSKANMSCHRSSIRS